MIWWASPNIRSVRVKGKDVWKSCSKRIKMPEEKWRTMWSVQRAAYRDCRVLRPFSLNKVVWCKRHGGLETSAGWRTTEEQIDFEGILALLTLTVFKHFDSQSVDNLCFVVFTHCPFPRRRLRSAPRRRLSSYANLVQGQRSILRKIWVLSRKKN